MRLVRAIVIGALLACATCGGAQAQSWPNRPVKIIVPLAPGGAADILGRIIAEHLSTAFGQQFFVENRASGGGVVGTAAAAAAEPDGYTLVVSSIAANVIAPAFSGRVGYDGLRDFTHIAYLGGPPAVLLTHPGLGAATFKDFVALARAATEPISCGSAGAGSNGALIAEYVARRENYRINHIPYKGAGPALMDLVAGHVKLASITVSTGAEQIRAGRVIALAVASETRMASFPDIPTFKEVGVDLVAATWFGLSGPKGMPPAVTNELSREILKAMRSPELQRRLEPEGIETKSMSAQEFTDFVQAEAQRWAPLAKLLSSANAEP
jgi:tripartite-type tricarboxylate transporter receptor subunit TctC